jgi:putative ABC transport system permease protein
MPTFLGDLKYGVRMLLAAPRVSGAAVLSLALGIGATAAIFTVVNAILLRPLPFPEPDRLVAVWETSPDTDRRWVAPANFLDWRSDAPAFLQLAAYDRYQVNLTGRERPERLRSASVSGNFFATLGVQAALGRTLTAAEDAVDAPPVAMLSHHGWRRLFGADPAAIGRTIVLDSRPHLIVGILPEAFDFLGPDIEVVTSGDRGVPNALRSMFADVTQLRDVHTIYVVGRLRSGATVEQAQAQLTAIMRRLEQMYPDTNSRLGARVVPLHQDMVGESRTALLLLLGAVSFLLLIACVNVANLLLARAIARQREMQIRVSLGAGRARLIRQVLTETLVLAAAGGTLGVVLATWGVPMLVALAPEGLPRASEIRVDRAMLLVTALLSLAAALAFGLVPALHGTGQSGTQTLHGDGTRVSESRGQRRMQQALVVSELMLAQVLLAGAGLLIASFVNVQKVDLGFRPERLLAVELTITSGKYKDSARKLAFHQAILERMAALPGVRSAAAALSPPLRGAINRGVWFVDRPQPPPGQQPNIDFLIVSAGYFRTLGIPLVAGRTFTEHDTLQSPLVAIISEAAARRYWPGVNALGRQIRFGGKQAEIVGIVGDVRQRDPARAPEPLLYVPLQQDSEPWNLMAFLLRTDGDPASVVTAATDAVLAVDRDQPVARVRTIDDIADTLLAGRRFNTVLLTVFSSVALLLAAIGTYGMLAYSVSRRTREIGVRMAIGARPSDVLRMVLGQGVRLVAAAVGLGIGGALATNRLLSQHLFGVGAADPAVLAAGAAALCLVAAAACYVPARRAMRIAPVEALRED